MLLDDEARLALARDGYLALPSITDAEDVSRIRAICAALIAAKAGYREGRQFDMLGEDRDQQAQKVPQILRPHLDAPALRRTRFYQAGEALARALLGREARFAFDHVIMKPAHDGAAVPFHQDEAFRDPAMIYQEITIWLPLQPVDLRNGCMQFIPGSHLGELLAHKRGEAGQPVHALECYGYDAAARVACPLPLGGCTVHAGRTAHGSGPNDSDAPRYAYSLVFSLPPRRREGPRAFDWADAAPTSRELREQSWRRRGGLGVMAWRKLRRGLFG